MKKILSILFVAILLVATLALVSCNKEEPEQHTEHKFIDVVVAPDCKTEAPGYTKHICSCGYEYIDSYVEAHQFTTTVVPATCHDVGYTLHVCDLCNYSKRDTYTEKRDPQNHVLSYPNDYWNDKLAGTSIIIDKVDSTCVDYGYTTYECVYCGTHVKQEIVSTLENHTYGEWNVLMESTCNTKGFKERYCTLCNAVEQVVLPLADHVWSEYKFVVDEIHLNALYEEKSCLSCKTTEANPVIIEDVLSFELVDNGSEKYYAVTGVNKGKNCSTIVIPAFMYLGDEKIPVKEIKASAFMYNEDLKVIYIPNSIEKIGAFAFTGTVLTDIYYGGTDAEWKTITKAEGWNYGANIGANAGDTEEANINFAR